jgi:hypothetical protein
MYSTGGSDTPTRIGDLDEPETETILKLPQSDQLGYVRLDLAMQRRQATISRKTNETEIEVALELDVVSIPGVAQEINISTGIGFLDHVWLPHILLLVPHTNPCRCSTLSQSMAGCPLPSNAKAISG